MTNIIAAIIITITTNWTIIGTFTPKGAVISEDVQRGQRATNTTAILEWQGQRREFTLKEDLGEVIGERKVPNMATNVAWGFCWPTNVIITNDTIKHQIWLNSRDAADGWLGR